MFSFDYYGFFSDSAIPGRETVISPQDASDWPPGQRPNWTGYAWVYLDFPPVTHTPLAPQTVSMRQARLALLGAGLLTHVNDALAVMPGIEGEAARIEWEYATEVKRDSALVTGMTAALGLTEAQLDALFIAAAAL